MGEYKLTPAARDDVIEIWNYTMKNWGRAQAKKYLLNIESQLKRLAGNPTLGRHRSEVREGYYSFPVMKHVIFYLKADGYIQIIGILHGRMDVDSRLL